MTAFNRYDKGVIKKSGFHALAELTWPPEIDRYNTAPNDKQHRVQVSGASTLRSLIRRLILFETIYLNI